MIEIFVSTPDHLDEKIINITDGDYAEIKKQLDEIYGNDGWTRYYKCK